MRKDRDKRKTKNRHRRGYKDQKNWNVLSKIDYRNIL